MTPMIITCCLSWFKIVFNFYINKYLLKFSIFSWGIKHINIKSIYFQYYYRLKLVKFYNYLIPEELNINNDMFNTFNIKIFSIFFLIIK